MRVSLFYLRGRLLVRITSHAADQPNNERLAIGNHLLGLCSAWGKCGTTANRATATGADAGMHVRQF
jgi:hypothetical protein